MIRESLQLQSSDVDIDNKLLSGDSICPNKADSASRRLVVTDTRKVITIRYTNYKGETALRHILPLQIRFVATEWHPEEQWVLEAFDLDKQAERSFAIKDILEWHPYGTENGAHTFASNSR